jgi:hypothetical protein
MMTLRVTHKKKGSKKSHMATSASAKVDEFAARFEDEFSLISCLSSSTVWYVDGGASSHMTRVREYFSSLQEEEMDLVIEMDNNTKCQAIGHGTITFQRESGKAIDGEGCVICSGHDEEPDISFNIGGQGLCGLILGWASVH